MILFRTRQQRAADRLAKLVEANRNSPACVDYRRHRAAAKGETV